MKASIRLAVLLVVTGLAVASPARAAHVGWVQTEHPCPHPACGDTYTTEGIEYAGDAGEANDVTIAVEAGGVVFRDAGAALAPGDRCAALGPNAVRCELASAGSVRIDTGDGPDRVTTESPQLALAVDGGSGDDELRGSRNADTLRGGGGRDVISGGGGEDSISDDDGAAGDADELDGGKGFDTVSYADRIAPVTLALGDPAGPDGDRVSGFEGAVGGDGDDRLSGAVAVGSRLGGGDGDDRLRGGPGPDDLHGGAGRDDVAGGPGRDQLSGGTGRDRLSGGDGDDGIEVRDARRDDVHCGAGRDTVTGTEEDEFNLSEHDLGPDARDRLARDCERTLVEIELDRVRPVPIRLQPLAIGARHLRLSNVCRPCRAGRLRLSAGGRVLGDVRLRRRRTIAVAWRRPLNTRRPVELHVRWRLAEPIVGPIEIAYTLRYSSAPPS